MDFYLSTIGENAGELARQYGLGIEIAEFCYSANMDTDFSHWDGIARANMAQIERRIFHAPCFDLCPAAIEPLLVEVTWKRYKQAYALMRTYGINKMVVHSGYIPQLYIKSWFIEKSVAFWRAFISDKPPEFLLLLENTLEEKPEMLCEIVEQVGDARFQLCLDIGHSGTVSSAVPVSYWVEHVAPYLGHVHVHNNYHISDKHNPPGDGIIDMSIVLNQITQAQPKATFTLETQDLQSSLTWLGTNGFIKGAANA